VYCPACGRTTTERQVGDIAVDVCDGGCGGVWFDRQELQKVDEAHESAGEALLDVRQDPQARADLAARRRCPRCADVVMMRHYTSVKREITVDECPACGGVFLDQGELRAIRTEFATEAERRQAARETFAQLFDEQLELEAAPGHENLSRAKQLAHLMRFLLPSYWLPGKQPWGAY
jgi:hypothetical protein